LGFALLMPVDARATDTFLSMSSDAGDYIGQGLTYHYTVADGPLTAEKNYDNGVSISFNTPTYDHFWYLDFAAPQSALLAPGVYAGATRFPFQAATVPGLDVGGDGRGCNTLTGSFEVKAIVYGAGTTIEAFWATFEQHCEGATPALRGEIFYSVPAALNFYTLTPCRVVDTRGTAGALGGPALTPGPGRTFAVAGTCLIPATAKALSVNVTVTGSTASGHLRMYPVGAALPTASAINYTTGQTRANNAIVPLGAGSDLVVACFQGSGKVDFILDVNGYFE
jgi:hypothetical protein